MSGPSEAQPVVVEGRPARLLLVHAHPDDETLATGVTIAHHVAAGDEVHVLTCTLGEEGEVIPPELAHLAGPAAGGTADGEGLARHRREELRGALAAVGAVGHVLGETPEGGARWRDSGMAGSSSAEHPRAWAGAPLADAGAAIRAVVEDLSPDVVVTYDAHGGYAHPDHVRTHDATRAALAAMPEADRPALFGVLVPRSWAQQDRAWLLDHAPEGRGWTQPDGPYPPSVVDDDVVTHAVLDQVAVGAQVAGLRHHRTQVSLDPPCYALSNDVVARLAGREGLARLDVATGEPVPATVPATGRPGLVARQATGPRR